MTPSSTYADRMTPLITPSQVLPALLKLKTLRGYKFIYDGPPATSDSLPVETRVAGRSDSSEEAAFRAREYWRIRCAGVGYW
jgi:hypothetical protein